MTRAIPERTFPLVEKFEGRVLRVYDDKFPNRILKAGMTIAGVLTAGVGHTGEDLYIGLVVTNAMADAWFASDMMQKAARPIERKVGPDIVNEMTENQYAALLSFVFNLGTDTPGKREWTLWTRLRNRNWDQVPGEMVQFVNWNGKRTESLFKRRTAEIAVWGEGEPNAHLGNIPSSITRREPTPPTPADPTPAHRSTTVWAALASAGAGAPVMVNQFAEAAGPYVQAAQTAQGAVQPLVPVAQSVSRFPPLLVMVLVLVALVAMGYGIHRLLRQKALARN